ncbi:MAG: divalent-cation tolerance protein CutA [Thermodesulfobacteriota bacterium]|nr:divalent-cation tolerance protein CutA [Thermodesulfobacteriota bacterium]
MAVNMIYITTENKMEAERIGRILVEERLAACVNIIDGMNSIYRWEGKLMQDTETVLIAKTVQDKVSALIERVKALHSYDCPCVVSLPIHDGNASFLNWVAEEVR